MPGAETENVQKAAVSVVGGHLEKRENWETQSGAAVTRRGFVW